MSTATDLLRSIRDNPDEDTPRLMYADHLDEEGDAPRAEFIRAQVERARLEPTDPRVRALEDREHELLAEHECEWLGVAAGDTEGLTEWEFERGFVAEVAASPVFMRTAGTDLCAAHPVCAWRVVSREGDKVEDLLDAVQRGWAARLERLSLSGCYGTLGEISRCLGARSHFARLRALDLTRCGPLDPIPEILEYAPFRDRLKVLAYGEAGYEGGRLDVPELVRALGANCRLEELAVPATQMFTPDALDLLAADALGSLVALDLRGNPIDADAAEGFRAARFRLRELDLSLTELGPTALGRILGCAALSELRGLHLNACGVRAETVGVLAASQFWAQAEELRMQGGAPWPAPGEGDEEEAGAGGEPVSLRPLFAARGSDRLHTLDVAGNRLGDAGVAGLCAAAWAGGLRYLDLSQNYLSDAALRELARSGRFKNLHTLHLNFNSVYHLPEATDSLSDAGLRALAECPDLANLRILTLSGTRISAAGVDAVLNGRYWRLAQLALAQCQLRTDVIDVFASSARTARLEALDLSGNDDIRGAALAALAESEYLSPLTELDVRGVHGGEKVRGELRRRLGERFRD